MYTAPPPVKDLQEDLPERWIRYFPDEQSAVSVESIPLSETADKSSPHSSRREEMEAR